MLRAFTFIILITVTASFFYALRKERGIFKRYLGELVSKSKNAFDKVRNPRKLSFGDLIGCLKVLSAFLAAVSAILLAISGFIPFLIFGKPLTGFILLFHVSVSPVFAVSMTIISLLWVKEHIFDSEDNIGLQKYRKMCFWFMILLTLVIMGTIILSMYPIFGSQWQENLLNLHLFSTLLFVAAGVIYSYISIISTIVGAKNRAE
jgi:hypothetical protein